MYSEVAFGKHANILMIALPALVIPNEEGKYH